MSKLVYIASPFSKICESCGFNFEVAMLEKIRAISSGKKANYEKARIEK